MTDNGSAYRSHALRKPIAEAGLRHIRTRPYTPRTNGKAARATGDACNWNDWFWTPRTCYATLDRHSRSEPSFDVAYIPIN